MINIQDYTIIFAVAGLVLGIINLILYFKSFLRNKPIIKISKIKGDINKENYMISLHLRLENQGYKSVGLFNCQSLVKHDQTWFSPNTNIILTNKLFLPTLSGKSLMKPEVKETALPLEIKELTPYILKVEMIFHDQRAFDKIIYNLPIKIKIILDFPHKEIIKTFFIGKKR